MISTSFDFRRQLAQNTKVAIRATLALADGTELELSGDDLVMGGLSVTQSTTTMGAFDVGAAVVGTCDLTLANYDERFDPLDFTGSTVAVWVGAELADGTTEWILRGTYGVEQPDSYGSTIRLHCLDNLRLLQVPYSGVATAYPATLGRIVREACEACGLVTAAASFDNDGYTVSARPDDQSLTCLDVVGMAAQVAGCFVTCDPLGRVRVSWYDSSAMEAEDWADGGTYDTDSTPYSDGDAAEGGGFMTGGDALSGGTFDEGAWCHLHAVSSLTVATDDVVVTGVRVTASQEVLEDGTMGDDGETSLYGTDGYVLSIEGNPLVEHGRAAAVAAQVGARVVGMRFRPLDAQGIASPAWEAGDPLVVTDARQRTHRSWLTSYTWKAGGYASLSCQAEAPARNSAAAARAKTRAIVELRKAARAERTARELAMQAMARQIANSSGLYVTRVAQPDGSTIYYAHDKPTLAESQIVWKLTAEAIGVSTDGGRTYPYALNVDGNAILGRIYAIGIDAQYVNTGRIQAQTGDDFWDLDSGELRMSAGAHLGTKTVQDVLDGVEAAVSGVQVEYAKSDSATIAPTTGWSTTHPTWEDGKYIWQRTKTTKAAGTSYSDPTNITGARGASGPAGTSVTVSGVEYGTSASASTQPTSWSPTAPTTIAQGAWPWVKTTYSDGSTATTRSYAGTNGTNGTNGKGISTYVDQYYLSTSDTSQTGDEWRSAQPTWQAGRYIWTRTLVTWDDGSSSTTPPVLAGALNSANQLAKAAGDAVTALDEDLDQAEIFNRLTNNSSAEGIYMHDGHLYLNMSMARTGTLKAGRIRSASGQSGWDLDTGILELGTDLVPLISQSELQVSRWIVSSSASCTVTKGSAYLACFSVEADDGIRSDNVRVMLGSTSGASYISAKHRVPLIEIGAESGMTRYACIIDKWSLSGQSASGAHLVISYGSSSGFDVDPYALHNVRVYKIPDSGDGVIGITAGAEGMPETMGAQLTAGELLLSVGDFVARLLPGLLQLTEDSYIDYDIPRQMMRIISPGGAIGIDPTNGLTLESSHGIGLSGTLRPGGSSTQASADVMAPAYNVVTVGSAVVRRWGAMVQLHATITYNGANGLAYDATGTLTSPYRLAQMASAVDGISPRPKVPTLAMGSSSTHGAARLTIGTDGYVTLVAVDGNGTAGRIAAGESFDIYATYMI